MYHDLSIAQVRSVEMYLVLIACQVLLVSLTFANPFHKYPYVFLLDIGNEELEKTNTEQIRISVPGGSIALRYPAIGGGDTITHVRVSGIDFGTDLKANVVDGGPGSKYVVIVFSGNQDTPYDAIMTIQTISDEDLNKNLNTDDVGNKYNTAEDNNDSAEDTNDVSTETKVSSGDANDSDSQSAGNTNAEIRQPSYNAYSYINSDTNDDCENANENKENENNQQYSDVNQKNDNEELNDELDQEVNQYSQVNSKQNSGINDIYRKPIQVEPQHSDFSDDYGNEDNDRGYNTGDTSKYTKYQSLMPKLYGGLRIYPQNAVPFILSDADNSVYDSEEPNEVDQTFNDKEYHNSKKNKDSNNNLYDSDDVSAVES